MTLTAFELLLLGSTVLLAVSALLFAFGNRRSGRYLSLSGFGLVVVVLIWIASRYATAGRSDQYFWALIAIVASILCLYAILLHSRNWERAPQLTTTAAVTLLVLVPFELVPALELALQEALANQFTHLFGWLGIQAVIEPSASTGGMYRLGFANGGNITITRGCTGIDAFALFSGLVLATRTSWRNRAIGLAFVLVAVALINSVRIVFVGAAMARDWFGPLIGASNTLDVTYLIAEVAIGQTFVILAAVVGFLYLSRWLPDMRAFVLDLFDTVVNREQPS